MKVFVFFLVFVTLNCVLSASKKLSRCSVFSHPPFNSSFYLKLNRTIKVSSLQTICHISPTSDSFLGGSEFSGDAHYY